MSKIKEHLNFKSVRRWQIDGWLWTLLPLKDCLGLIIKHLGKISPFSFITRQVIFLQDVPNFVTLINLRPNRPSSASPHLPNRISPLNSQISILITHVHVPLVGSSHNPIIFFGTSHKDNSLFSDYHRSVVYTNIHKKDELCKPHLGRKRDLLLGAALIVPSRRVFNF